jgi:phosphate uptake regulator
METRKLISFGKSSFVISIPRIWVVRNNLSKGSQLFLEEEFDSLRLTPKLVPMAKNKKKVIDAQNRSPGVMESMIISSYLNNYATIEIVHLSKNEQTLMKSFLRTLIGIEIIEETNTSIVARDLLNVTEISIDTIVRRMDALVRSMLDELVSPDTDGSKFIHDKDSDVNRMSFLALRAFRSMIESPALLRVFNVAPMDILITWQLIVQIERIGDQAKRLAQDLRDYELKPRERLQFGELFKQVQGLYLTAIKANYARDREACFEIETSSRSLLKKCDEFGQQNMSVASAYGNEKLKGMIYPIRDIARAVMESE